jgi:Cu/Ag efflux pump CusA
MLQKIIAFSVKQKLLVALGVVAVALAGLISYKFLEKKRAKSGINK